MLLTDKATKYNLLEYFWAENAELSKPIILSNENKMTFPTYLVEVGCKECLALAWLFTKFT